MSDFPYAHLIRGMGPNDLSGVILIFVNRFYENEIPDENYLHVSSNSNFGF